MVKFTSFKQSLTDCVNETKKVMKPLEDKICSLDKDSIKTGYTDLLASASKIGLGFCPLIGPIIGELVAAVIPNQRMDRVYKYVTVLENRLSLLEKSVIIPITDEHFRSLVVESCIQAAQTVNDKRRDYIASIVANGISKDHADLFKALDLLQTFKHLQEVEISILKSYGAHPSVMGDVNSHMKENEYQPIFQEKDVLTDFSEDEKLQDTYKNHLCQLGLLNHREDESLTYHNPMDDYYSISQFGETLLKYMGLDNTGQCS